MTENGRLCNGNGGHEGGDRRRRVLMLPTLPLPEHHEVVALTKRQCMVALIGSRIRS